MAEHEDASDGDDEELPEPNPALWQLVVTEVEGGVFWEDGCRVLADAHDSLALLQEIDEDDVDWDTLLRGLTRLQVLRTMDYPPLHNLLDFMEFDEFLTVTHKDDIYPAVHKVYLTVCEPEALEPLLGEFAELSRRLKNYPPLAPYL